MPACDGTMASIFTCNSIVNLHQCSSLKEIYRASNDFYCSIVSSMLSILILIRVNLFLSREVIDIRSTNNS